MNAYLPQMAKALMAGGIAFTGAVAVAYTDGVATTAEWWTAASAGLVALGGVWGIPNAREKRRLRVEDVPHEKVP